MGRSGGPDPSGEEAGSRPSLLQPGMEPVAAAVIALVVAELTVWRWPLVGLALHGVVLCWLVTVHTVRSLRGVPSPLARQDRRPPTTLALALVAVLRILSFTLVQPGLPGQVTLLLPMVGIGVGLALFTWHYPRVTAGPQGRPAGHGLQVSAVLVSGALGVTGGVLIAAETVVQVSPGAFDGWALLALVAVPFLSEWLYRGVLQTSLCWTVPRWAAPASASLFAAAYAGWRSPAVMLLAVSLGGWLARCRARGAHVVLLGCAHALALAVVTALLAQLPLG